MSSKLKSLFATGKDIFNRLARKGPPMDITIKGLPARNQKTMSIEEALKAKPENTNNPPEF